jgi:hypothetical protein
MVGEILTVVFVNLGDRARWLSDHVGNAFESVLTQNSCAYFFFGAHQQRSVGMQRKFLKINGHANQHLPTVGHQHYNGTTTAALKRLNEKKMTRLKSTKNGLRRSQSQDVKRPKEGSGSSSGS